MERYLLLSFSTNQQFWCYLSTLSIFHHVEFQISWRVWVSLYLLHNCSHYFLQYPSFLLQVQYQFFGLQDHGDGLMKVCWIGVSHWKRLKLKAYHLGNWYAWQTAGEPMWKLFAQIRAAFTNSASLSLAVLHQRIVIWFYHMIEELLNRYF